MVQRISNGLFKFRILEKINLRNLGINVKNKGRRKTINKKVKTIN